jgi:hypothetical protein
MDEERNLPHGHADRICTIDLLAVDAQIRKDNDDDSLAPSDWLKQSGQLHNSVDMEYGKGTYMRFMIGNQMSKYAALLTSVKSWLGNIITKKCATWEAETKAKCCSIQCQSQETQARS